MDEAERQRHTPTTDPGEELNPKHRGYVVGFDWWPLSKNTALRASRDDFFRKIEEHNKEVAREQEAENRRQNDEGGA